MPKPKQMDQQTIEVAALRYGCVGVRIIGETPLVMHSMASKLKHLVSKESRRKSGPRDLRAEFEAGFYRMLDDGPTAYYMPGSAFKSAMVEAARHVPGVTMKALKQLVRVMQDRVPIWGTPTVLVSVVRLADISKTPEVRVRPLFRRWCAEFDVQHLLPAVDQNAIAALLANAGKLIGVGDGRPEKGALNYGTFRLLESDADEAAFEELKANEGVEAQLAAEAAFEPADPESADLLTWWNDWYNAKTGRAAA